MRGNRGDELLGLAHGLVVPGRFAVGITRGHVVGAVVLRVEEVGVADAGRDRQRAPGIAHGVVAQPVLAGRVGNAVVPTGYAQPGGDEHGALEVVERSGRQRGLVGEGPLGNLHAPAEAA